MKAIIRWVALSGIASTGLIAVAQTTPAEKAVPEKVVGCVTQQKDAPGFYVISAQDRCMQLSGKFDAAKFVNHRVTFHGLLSEATSTTPSTLKITDPGVVGDACTQTCELVPPGHRGLHGHPVPGTEGGTHGAAPIEPPH